MAVNLSAVVFTQNQDSTSSTQFYSITWTSVEVVKIGYGSADGQPLPSWLNVSLFNSSSPMPLNLSVNTTGLALGTYTTTLGIASIKIPNQVMDIIDIPVTLNVVEPATAAPQTLNFTMTEGSLPPVQTVTLTRNTGSVSVTNAFTWGGVSWLTLSPGGSNVNFSLNSAAQSLAPGVYAAMVYINYDGGQTSVNVNLTVNSSLKVPGGVTFNINAGSTDADKTKSITIASNRASSISWNASVDRPWMQVAPASGITGSPDNITITLLQSQLDLLPNGTHAGNIAVSSPDPTVSMVNIPVTLNISAPQVSYVAPYEGVSNRPGNVVIRGTGFQSLINPTVTFGSNLATAFTIISDTEIHAAYGALASGDYPVNVQGTNLVLVSFATVVVRDPPGYGYFVIPKSEEVKDIFYDVRQQALFVTMANSPALQRWKYYPGSLVQWTFGGVSDIVIQYGGVARAPNGKAIYAAQQRAGDVLKIDPATLGTQRLMGNSSAYGIYSSGAFANDGKLLLAETNGIYRYDTDANSFVFPGYYYSNDNAERIAKASLDGSKVFFVGRNKNTFVQVYDASTGQLTVSSMSIQSTTVSVDQNGSRLLIGRGIYDGSLTPLGTLPANSFGGVVTADGAYVYTYVPGTTGGTVRKYDLNTADGFGGFVEVGSGTRIPDSPGSGTIAMTLTADQGTLFIAGGMNLIVVPVP